MKPIVHSHRGLRNIAQGTGAFLLAAASISVAGAQTNTKAGVSALASVTTGKNNSAFGYFSLNKNTTGNFNTAVGSTAMQNNASGGSNTAIGIAALFKNTTGAYNTAAGRNSLKANVTGVKNAAYGHKSLYKNTNGGSNVAIGNGAMINNTTGSNNIGIGEYGGGQNTTGNNNINIGNQGSSSGSGIIRIGTDGTHTATLLAGNVGLGTTNPSGHFQMDEGRLIVSGSNAIDTTNFSGLGFQFNEGSGEGAIMASYDDGYGALGFYTKQAAGQPVTKRMVIDKAGNVGIGNNSPGQKLSVTGNSSFIGNVAIGVASNTRAKLEVSGVAGSYAYGQRGVLNSTGATSLASTGTDTSASIWASNFVWATSFLAFSDERIKHVEGRSDAGKDLATLRGIEVTDYTYIDTVARGAGKVKKVIAQQVKKVYPQAVNTSTDVVPDIYKDAAIKDGWVTLATNLKKGDRVRLIDGEKDGIHEVLEVGDGKFKTDFAADSKDVFVYGRQVNDFLGVDYEALAMLNVSATQELARKLEAKDAELAKLAAENAAMKQKLVDIETSNEKRLAKIEAKLSTRGGEAMTVSVETK